MSNETLELEEEELKLKKLEAICLQQLKEKGLTSEYEKRLRNELKEVYAQDEQGYFLDLYESKTKYPYNEHNLLVPYVLGIVDDFEMDKETAYVLGDLPDIDVDYLPEIRDYLKEKYTPETFGKEKVCNVATYGKMGVKSALIDCARIFDLDHLEVKAITKKLKLKDEEENDLFLDDLIEIYDDLKEYCERNPEVADAVRKLQGKYRNLGVHASGLIISNENISDFVPLVLPTGSTVPAAAWTEGQRSSDLSAVGLIKFDYLSLDSNGKIADTLHFIESINKNPNAVTAHNVITSATDKTGFVSALPGQGNWSDTSYLDDPKCMEFAKRGDLKMIFQFDGSDGIRRLARDVVASSFEDLAACTALFRPGCLKKGMHETYIRRKKGLEEYELHPVIEPILKKTYGIMVYQETITQILNKVGKIPMKDCETIRKAISKKKIENFKIAKEKFISRGQKTLGKDEEFLEELWSTIESWASYGFNRSHAVAYTVISARSLYLKAHYPREFYCSFMTHCDPTGEKGYQQLKEYKQEIERHGLRVMPISVNNSKNEFIFNEEKIYWAFSKLKGVGEAVAKEIVRHQPYTGYEDFLNRFGTNAACNQALIALGAFKEDHPTKLYKFYLTYKMKKRKVDMWEAAFVEAKEKVAAKLKDLLNRDAVPETLTREELEDKAVKKILTSWNRSLNSYKSHDTTLPTLKNFDPETDFMYDKKDEEKIKQMLEIMDSQHLSEEEFYGFVWNHPLEKSPDFSGATVSKFGEENYDVGPLELLLKRIEFAKGQKTNFYRVSGEDANGQFAKITVWESDFKLFQDELKVGNMVRISVKAPNNGFPTYTIAYAPRRRDWTQKPSKENDFRVVKMK